MREILFRGKMVNGIWVEGFMIRLYHQGLQCIAIINPIETLVADSTFAIAFSKEEVHAVIPETVGQFTGLLDKNGKKIFEGDILKCYDHPTDLESGIYQTSFELGSFMAGIMPVGEWGTAWIEVIGNIHDNPELIK